MYVVLDNNSRLFLYFSVLPSCKADSICWLSFPLVLNTPVCCGCIYMRRRSVSDLYVLRKTKISDLASATFLYLYAVSAIVTYVNADFSHRRFRNFVFNTTKQRDCPLTAGLFWADACRWDGSAAGSRGRYTDTNFRLHSKSFHSIWMTFFLFNLANLYSFNTIVSVYCIACLWMRIDLWQNRLHTAPPMRKWTFQTLSFVLEFDVFHLLRVLRTFFISICSRIIT